MEKENLSKREILWRILNEGEGIWGRLWNWLTIVLIVISVVTIPADFFNVFHKYQSLFNTVEIVVVSIFSFDYLIRILVAPSRLGYIFSFWGMIDLISILPALISLSSTQWVRALRLMRIARILKVSRILAQHEHTATFDRLPDEKVERKICKHPFFIVVGSFLPLIFTSLGLIILLIFDFSALAIGFSTILFTFAVIFFVKIWIDYFGDMIIITNRRIIFQDRSILANASNTVDYYAITNIIPRKAGILAFLFGYGSLEIETAADSTLTTIHFDHIKDHEEAAHHISENKHKHLSRTMEPLRETENNQPSPPDNQPAATTETMNDQASVAPPLADQTPPVVENQPSSLPDSTPNNPSPPAPPPPREDSL